MSDGPLDNGVAVITGAASGIGKGIAKAAASRRMKLVLVDVATDGLNALAAELEQHGVEVLACRADVQDAAALEGVADATFERFGSVRLLVNNAGLGAVGHLWELPSEQLARTVGVNILGPMLSVRAFLPRMIASASPGFITNLSSAGALAMVPLQGAYILSKHAVLSYSECLSLELQLAAPFIQVSAVLPGSVRTGIFSSATGVTGSAAIAHAELMNSILDEHGISPEEAGELILGQVAEGKFWIDTHPDLLKQLAEERAEYLRQRRSPSLSPLLIPLFPAAE
jgi:short-subunit dehydrogenase